MKKFNLDSLEKKLNNLSNNLLQEGDIIKKTYKKYNNKSIETILYFISICFEQDYLNASEEYNERINYFSDNYLLGSEWYIGPEYTRDYHYSQLDLDTQYKFIGLIYFLSSIYNK